MFRGALSVCTRVGLRGFASSSTALRIPKFGHWENVLVEEKMSLEDPKDNEVLVRMQAAPINPADIDVISGTYGRLPNLPAIAGLEGVGIVEEVGSSVKSVSKGQRVIPATPGSGTWRTHAVFSEDNVLPVSADIPVEYAATLSVNPCTAYRLLADFADLKEGDVVVQNGANSAVGQAVIQLCDMMGVETVNIIRGRVDHADTVEYLKSIGGTVVCTQEHINAVGIRSVTDGLPKASLALNCVGGQSALDCARMLGDGGAFVTYGGMGRQPVMLPTGPMIFNNISAHGFWMTQWVSQASKADRVDMLTEISDMIKDGSLRLLMEKKPFGDWKDAITTAQHPSNSRKIVMRMD